jgi:hypothetical protein
MMMLISPAARARRMKNGPVTATAPAAAPALSRTRRLKRLAASSVGSAEPALLVSLGHWWFLPLKQG